MWRKIYVTLMVIVTLATVAFAVEGEDYLAGVIGVKFDGPIVLSRNDGVCYTGIPDVDALNDYYGVYEMVQDFPLRDEEGFVTCEGKWSYADFAEGWEKLGMGNIYTIRYSAEFDAAEVAIAYDSLDSIEETSVIPISELQVAPIDEFYVHQWNLHQSEPYSIKAENAWDVTTGDSDVIVSVVDTGIWTDHNDFTNRIAQGYNYVGNWYDMYDNYGHGTSVSGIIAANGIFPGDPISSLESGIAGIDDKCWILPMKVGDSAALEEEYLDNAIYDSVYFGAWVINMSYSHRTAGEISVPEKFACIFAYRQGRLLVASAGNYGDGSWGGPDVRYPAAHSEVVAVGGTTQTGYRHYLSCYGDDLELTAPWPLIPAPDINTTPGNKYFGKYYCDFSGTSASAPHVSGVAALIWADNPGWTNVQVRKKMQGSITIPAGMSPGWNMYTGYGIINATEALDAKGGKDGGTAECLEGNKVPETTLVPSFTTANPAREAVGIKFVSATGKYSAAAYDVRGRKVEEWSGNGGKVQINWDIKSSNVAPGLYLIKIDTGADTAVLKTVITR